jgi:hypothetical protein
MLNGCLYLMVMDLPDGMDDQEGSSMGRFRPVKLFTHYRYVDLSRLSANSLAMIRKLDFTCTSD